MSKRYTGNFISGTPQVPTLSSNNGIFDINDVYTAVSNGTWQEPDGVYEIPKSLRFRSSASSFLSKTFAADGNRKLWTFSAWVKLGNNAFYMCAGAGTGIGVDVERMSFDTGGNGWYWQRASIQTSTTYQQDTNSRFRDHSAWYHIMCIWDSNNPIQSERWRTFVNGVKQSRSYGDGAISQGQNSLFNSTSPWKIGRSDDTGSSYADCYLAEVNFIDGQSLDPSYFGYTDPVTNIWQPKKYTGGYGGNSFYLPFTEPVAASGTVGNNNLGRNFAGGTNYIRYSQDGSQTSYGYAYERATNTVNNVVAPDGTTTGNKLTADGTASNTHRFYCGTVATPAGTTQTVSIYLKYHSCRYVNIENWNGSTYQTQTFDILNGVPMVGGSAVSAVGFTYQFVGNGWYRVSVPLYAGSANTGGPSIAVYLCDASGNVSWNGDSTSAVYWWGAQLNLGTTADPYFKTAGTTAPNNDWGVTGFSVSSGTTYDIMNDSPTNVFTSATDVGGVVSGNYCTLNPLSNGNTLSNGNLKAVTGTNTASLGTLSVSSGKWYYEATITTVGGSFPFVGIIPNTYYFGSGTASWAGSTPALWVGNGGFANGDVIGVAFDLDTLTFNAYKNGTLMTVASSYVSSNSISAGYTWTPILSGVSSTIEMNFGQRPFTYTPPAGYKSLNTTNIQALGTAAVGKPAIQPNKWFDITLYGGTGAARTITNSGGFVPDLVWTKVRNTTYSHNITDSARGAGLRLYSDGTAAEAQIPNGGVTSFNTASNNGYTINSGVEVNEIGRPYIAWQWKQSPTSGFNIVTYTGDGTSNRAISHNLGATPAFQIVKARSGGNAATSNWLVHHQSQATGYTSYLNTTAVQDSGTSQWGSSAATSSNFYVGYTGGAPAANENGTLYVAYLWAEVPGFSKFGSYVGNSSSDGPFVYTGFRPKFILTKALGTANGTTTSTVWNIWDATRNPNNPTLNELYPNRTDADTVDSSGVDILSNGFKPKRNSEYANWSGTTYIYAAFAESPVALNNRAR